MKAAFKVPDKLDYRALDLKVGFEIHQQLDTKHKLFCNCPTKLASEEEISKAPRVVRRLRATRSELGEIDQAAAFEEQRQRVFEYIAPPSCSCLVELDEEPPHEMNREALAIAIAIAKALHANIVDEVHVMRKIVVDGSNTTGFQRTAIVAYGGYIEDEEGVVRIQTITVEEDAARKIDEKDGRVVYCLDRMGIPLIEISTAPDVKSPEQAKRVLYRIGLLMRLTGKVKRGIGTIRQDINLSIAGCPKIEIKGVQRLELVPRIIENEVRRLVGLLMIRDELRRRGASEEEVLSQPIIDVTDVLADCKSKIISTALQKGHRVYAVKLPRFAGLLGVELQPNRRFGTELADYARQWAGVKGIIHSDELPGYGIDEEHVERIKKVLGVQEMDAFVIVVDEESKARKALEVVKQRAAIAIQGVPKETRAANDDGTTRYMRPQPGAARMYPETDIPPIRIDEEILREAEKYIPPDPREKLKELCERYGLSRSLAEQLLHSEYLALFEKLVNKYPVVPPVTIASIFTTIRGELRSEGIDIDHLSDEDFELVVKMVATNAIPRDAVKEVLKIIASEGIRDEKTILERIGTRVSIEEVYKLVREIVDRYRDEIIRRGDKAFNFVMGKVMTVLRGRVEGKIVADVVKRAISDIRRSSS